MVSHTASLLASWNLEHIRLKTMWQSQDEENKEEEEKEEE